jgi:CRISPR-associated protein Cas2
MSDTALYVIAYDISDDRERRQADQILQGFGFRRQKSVFECRLSRGHLARLQRELDTLRMETGFVMIYHLAPNTRALTVGEVPHFPDDDWAWVT